VNIEFVLTNLMQGIGHLMFGSGVVKKMTSLINLKNKITIIGMTHFRAPYIFVVKKMTSLINLKNKIAIIGILILGHHIFFGSPRMK